MQTHPIRNPTDIEEINKKNKKNLEIENDIWEYVNATCQVDYDAFILGTCCEYFETGKQSTTINNKIGIILDFAAGLGVSLIFIPGVQWLGAISLIAAVVIDIIL